jgi:uracil phosphoribosyltransferase
MIVKIRSQYMVATAELDRIFSSPYQDIQRARELFELDNCLPPGMTMVEVDQLCLEAQQSGFLVIAGNGSVGETAVSGDVGVRNMMSEIKNKALSRREYRSYADRLIQRVVDEVEPVYESGEQASIAISVRGGLPFEKPLFEQLHNADTGFTQQTRHEVSMFVDSIPSKMGSFAREHTFAADFMVATGGSMIDLLEQSVSEGAEKCTVLGAFMTPQAFARLYYANLSRGAFIERVISLPLEAGLITLGPEAKNFIFGGISREFEGLSKEKLLKRMVRFMLGDHGNRYYKDLSSSVHLS